MKKEETILVIEDDRNLQIALKTKLQSEGWQVLQAYNGQEGLELLKKNDAISVVLLDVAMPIMNGFEALKIIRQDERLKDTKVIIISNSIYEPLKTEENIKLLESTPYIIKSNYSLSQVVDKIKAFLVS
jgi:two-component system chemotaxis sensor kinase CheA